jgi:hypothetical protein
MIGYLKDLPRVFSLSSGEVLNRSTNRLEVSRSLFSLRTWEEDRTARDGMGWLHSEDNARGGPL